MENPVGEINCAQGAVSRPGEGVSAKRSMKILVREVWLLGWFQLVSFPDMGLG